MKLSFPSFFKQRFFAQTKEIENQKLISFFIVFLFFSILLWVLVVDRKTDLHHQVMNGGSFLLVKVRCQIFKMVGGIYVVNLSN